MVRYSLPCLFYLCSLILFQEDPEGVYKALNVLGVDAYRGATQLNIVEPDDIEGSHYPHEAKYLIDHVVYLPVNKTVPYNELDRICRAVEKVMKRYNSKMYLSQQKEIKLQAKL